MQITFSKEHGYVIIAAGLLAFQTTILGFRYAGMGRKVFNSKEFQDKAASTGLLEEHKKATGKDALPRGGYPDHGTGRYSALLSYGDWLKFSWGQRVHGHAVENVATVFGMTILSGIVYPLYTAIAAGAYIVGREIYSAGYAKKGPDGRMAGVLLVDLAMLYLFGSCMAAGAKVAGLF